MRPWRASFSLDEPAVDHGGLGGLQDIHPAGHEAVFPETSDHCDWSRGRDVKRPHLPRIASNSSLRRWYASSSNAHHYQSSIESRWKLRVPRLCGTVAFEDPTSPTLTYNSTDWTGAVSAFWWWLHVTVALIQTSPGPQALPESLLPSFKSSYEVIAVIGSFI